MKQPIKGIIAAPFTPMMADGSLNLAQIEHLATSLKANGVGGAFICGTTGEGLSMTVAERKAVAEAWQKQAGPDLQIIVHVGHLCLADAQELAAHAESVGVRAIASIAPAFFQAEQPAELVSFFAEITAAAPNLPFYYYHIPSMTHFKFQGIDFLKAASASGQLPTLAGIKYTHENLMDFSECYDFEDGRYDLLFGRDEILLAGLVMGAQGAVGSTYNFAAPLYLRIIEAFEAGNLQTSRALQNQARQLIQVLVKSNSLANQKAVMSLLGLDCGPVRLPLRSPTAVEMEGLRNQLEQIGFFKYCSIKAPATLLVAAIKGEVLV